MIDVRLLCEHVFVKELLEIYGEDFYKFMKLRE